MSLNLDVTERGAENFPAALSMFLCIVTDSRILRQDDGDTFVVLTSFAEAA